MKFLKVLFASALALLAFITQNLKPSLAFDCYASPDKWFNTKMQFDTKTFPTNISITEDNDIFSITNPTKSPLYIMNPNPAITTPWEPDVFDNPGIPLGFYPVYRIINNQVSVWSSSETGKIGWEEIPNFTNVTVDTHIYHLVEKSNQIYQDNRPDIKSIKIPQLNVFKIYTFKDNTEYEISGTISYTINENYTPTKGADSAKYCEQAQQKWLDGFTQNEETLPKTFFGKIIYWFKSW
jgi:hypothetical protein